MKTYNCHNIKFRFDILRENRKTLAIYVYPTLVVYVKAPVKASDSEILAFTKKKALWISKQLEYFKQHRHKNMDDCISGSEIFYIGKQYQLIVVPSVGLGEKIELAKNQIKLFSSEPKDIKHNTKKILDWLRLQAQREFRNALKRCIKRFPNLQVPELKIRKLSKRWGSYQKETIILNPALIFTRKSCIEYVITHELCHNYHKRHSPIFYSMLGSKIPKWKTIKEELENTKYIFE